MEKRMPYSTKKTTECCQQVGCAPRTDLNRPVKWCAMRIQAQHAAWLIIGAVFLAASLFSGCDGPGGSGMHIKGVMHANINCSSYDRSLSFYKKLGFLVLMEVEDSVTEEFAKDLFEDFVVSDNPKRYKALHYAQEKGNEYREIYDIFCDIVELIED